MQAATVAPLEDNGGDTKGLSSYSKSTNFTLEHFQPFFWPLSRVPVFFLLLFEHFNIPNDDLLFNVDLYFNIFFWFSYMFLDFRSTLIVFLFCVGQNDIVPLVVI
jgi:hypothetical protein